MNATQLVAELLIVGCLSLLGAAAVFRLPLAQGLNLPPEPQVLVVTVFIGLAYLVGFIINAVAEAVFSPLNRMIEDRWMSREGNPSLVPGHLRYDLYASSTPMVVQRLEYHRSLLRLSRSIALSSLLLVLLATIFGNFIIGAICFVFSILSIFSFCRRAMWFTRSVYFSWLANRRTNGAHGPEEKPDKCDAVPKDGPPSDTHIIVFAGGTGFREINIRLARLAPNVSRIVPVWDDGGSSKILRQHFAVIPIGDVRHVLMTMAYAEGRVGQVIKLFGKRLPDTGSQDGLRKGLHLLASGQHPLMTSIEPSLRDVIVEYLRQFESAIPMDMDLRHGSIGNFVLLGAYLAHGRNMNVAIYLFRQLCSIREEVRPVSLQTDVHLTACLQNGSRIVGQDLITKLDRNEHREKIKSVLFTKYGTEEECLGQVKANPLVLEDLKGAEIVVFGPGSFFTSILPHLMVEGVADAVASLEIPKVLVGNMLECDETYNYTLEELVAIFLDTANQFAKEKRSASKYLTHVLVHRSNSEGLSAGLGRRYLPVGPDIQRFAHEGIALIERDFEDAWRRGYHDPDLVANLIIELAKG